MKWNEWNGWVLDSEWALRKNNGLEATGDQENGLTEGYRKHRGEHASISNTTRVLSIAKENDQKNQS